MKTTFTLLFFSMVAFSQQTTLQVVGKNLTKIGGQNITLRGVNYPLIDEGVISLSNASSYKFYIDEVAKTGANAVRLPWYTNGVHWRDVQTPGTLSGYINNGHLSNIISYCITKGMIPILEIHDLTCTDDWAGFNSTIMNFWTSPGILNVINANKSKLIINIANEFGKVSWSNNPATAINTFKTNYNNAVLTLRNAGINVPLMIDAPDCGTSSTDLLSIALSMNNSDPRHNLIFSAHTYWGDSANTLAQVQIKLNEAQNTNVCFVLGEVAKNQDDTSCGSMDLSMLYPQILTEACSRNIGWLAWTFDQDCSPARQLTTNGIFSNLTAFGNDIVYNTTYGLKSTAGCGAATLSNSSFETEKVSVLISPNPSNGLFTITTNESLKKVQLFDAIGKEVNLKKINETSFELQNSVNGIYFVKIETENNGFIFKKLIVGG